MVIRRAGYWFIATWLLIGAAAGCAPTPGPRECAVEVRGLSPRDAAVRCAETFVARNGYTTAPATERLDRIAWETVEEPLPPAEIVALRRGELEPRAEWLCTLRFLRLREPGFTVGFRLRSTPLIDTLQMHRNFPSLDTLLRAVTMDTMFSDLRMEHMPLIVGDKEFLDSSCAPLIPR